MDAKTELKGKLYILFPNAVDQIAQIVDQFTVLREPEKCRSNLKQRISSFLTAKKIDGLSAKTLKNYREMLTAFSVRVDKHVSKITTDDIRAYIGFLSEEKRLKDSSIQTYINTLRSFFSWLDSEDVIKKNPMRKIKSLKLDRTKSRRPLTQEELEQLRDGCRTYKEKALVEFLVSTGCRLGEVQQIRLDQISWQDRSVTVLGKGNKERLVYFSVRAKVMIQAYLAVRKGGNALFASSRTPYEPMQPRAIQKALQKIGEWAQESRRIHPHLLRHTFATSAINAGMELAVLQLLLGHSDPKTTLIYAKLSPQMVRYAYEKSVA